MLTSDVCSLTVSISEVLSQSNRENILKTNKKILKKNSQEEQIMPKYPFKHLQIPFA
jgi:hypothetical protein